MYSTMLLTSRGTSCPGCPLCCTSSRGIPNTLAVLRESLREVERLFLIASTAWLLQSVYRERWREQGHVLVTSLYKHAIMGGARTPTINSGQQEQNKLKIEAGPLPSRKRWFLSCVSVEMRRAYTSRAFDRTAVRCGTPILMMVAGGCHLVQHAITNHTATVHKLLMS